jgi:glucosamine--fructose-6-phosphate aminotransferase (isomerizing)
MCGIIGVLGQHEVAPTLVEALRRLEYRGYDSAGIATVNNGVLDRRRAVGKLVNLSDLLVHEPLAGKSGIGHTRWATHGSPTTDNAHPHQAGPVAVVHNGIIENFRELREELAGYGINFVTETDTETVALLTQHYMESGLSPADAAEKTISRLDGAFALAFLFHGEEDLMIAARKGSPLAIGHGSKEMYIGSDAIALAPLTNRITYLEEGDRAVLTRDSLLIWDNAGHQVGREMRVIEIDTAKVDKAGFDHYMAKEITEQPAVVGAAVNNYLPAGGDQIALPGGNIDFSKIERLSMVACGTAFYACLTGETADTLAALRYCAGKADKILSVTNVAESSIARESDQTYPIFAGVEIGVASTKAFTCQLTVLLSLALKAAQDRGTMSETELKDAANAMRSAPGLLNVALEQSDAIKHHARKLSQARDILFLGRGLMYPIAHEGALKLKEISYIHAEAYASGELKHGPIALIDKKVPVVVLAPSDELYDKSISNMQEVMARSGKVLLISDRKGLKIAGDVWGEIVMPECDPLITPIIYSIPAQLLAYHTAVAKGTDVDQPRNLAKSVTVE